ncbi:50S ribosomal protein L11 methyltransferase [Streptosporangium sp. NPDC020145]|uniref:50S ribosomal protein L11 methyltransferase n=1 Tax=Streptosporangium sp. NPDC020145 TaxID=3154694 RepID=UPI003425469A
MWQPGAQVARARGVQALRSLRGALREVGFTEEATVAALSAEDSTDLLSNTAFYAVCSAERVPELLTSAAGAMVQLFVRNGEVPGDVYTKVVPTGLRGLLAGLELVVERDGTVTSEVSVSPCRSMYLLSDQLFRDDASVTMAGRSTLVMPPHASSFELLDNLGPVDGRLLDVGCGCGVLALALREGCSSAVGVDLNPRAVAYSQVNALVNGIDVGPAEKTDFLAADLRSGLAVGDLADHLVFNSPTGPNHHAEAEVGWMSAEHAIGFVAAAMPGVLRPWGTARVLLIVEVPEGAASVPELVRGWLPEEQDVQVVELRRSPLAISAAAVTRGRLDPGCLMADGAAGAARLVDHLRERRIREVVPALVTLALPR